MSIIRCVRLLVDGFKDARDRVMSGVQRLQWRLSPRRAVIAEAEGIAIYEAMAPALVEWGALERRRRAEAQQRTYDRMMAAFDETHDRRPDGDSSPGQSRNGSE
jgi:hypothetical protein